MRKPTIYFFLLFGLVLLCGCGDDSDEPVPLADAIIGSWRSADPSLNTTYIADDVTAKMAMELTFYADDRFDLITTTVLGSADSEALATTTMITSGEYEAFESSVALRPGETEVRTVPVEMQTFMEEDMEPAARELESTVLGTWDARVEGGSLWLDEDRWERM